MDGWLIYSCFTEVAVSQDLDPTGWFWILEPHISPPPADDILVVSLSPKAGRRTAPTANQSLLKTGFLQNKSQIQIMKQQ